jgi:hypothetical protein
VTQETNLPEDLELLTRQQMTKVATKRQPPAEVPPHLLVAVPALWKQHSFLLLEMTASRVSEEKQVPQSFEQQLKLMPEKTTMQLWKAVTVPKKKSPYPIASLHKLTALTAAVAAATAAAEAALLMEMKLAMSRVCSMMRSTQMEVPLME